MRLTVSFMTQHEDKVFEHATAIVGHAGELSVYATTPGQILYTNASSLAAIYRPGSWSRVERTETCETPTSSS